MTIGDDIVYQTIAARRLHTDNLLWQVPALTFTGQAFLLSTALGPETRTTARVIAASLSVLVSFLSMVLMKRNRQSEVNDALWLIEIENERRGGEAPIHARDTRRSRAEAEGPEGFVDRFTPSMGAYRAWMLGMTLFFVAATAVVAIAIWWPGLLAK